MKVIYSEAARAEIETVQRFYAAENPYLGERMQENLRRLERLLIRNPRAGHRVGHECRRVLLRNFPISLIYRLDSDAEVIEIAAVSHQSRRPDYWRNRVREQPAMYAPAVLASRWSKSAASGGYNGASL